MFGAVGQFSAALVRRGQFSAVSATLKIDHCTVYSAKLLSLPFSRGQHGGIVNSCSFRDYVARVQTRPLVTMSGRLVPQLIDLATLPSGVWRFRCAASLLLTSCLISEFRCLRSLHVFNKDAISYTLDLMFRCCVCQPPNFTGLSILLPIKQVNLGGIDL